MYSLVLDKGQKVRDKQLRQLQDHADRDVYTLTLRLMPEMNGLEIKYRLPLIDIAIPALKQLSISQYESFRHNLLAVDRDGFQDRSAGMVVTENSVQSSERAVFQAATYESGIFPPRGRSKTKLR